jgi:hypothetical protein
VFLVLVGGAVHDEAVWDGGRSEAEEVMGVLMNL